MQNDNIRIISSPVAKGQYPEGGRGYHISPHRRSAFTLVEVVAALALLTLMLSSVLMLMDRFVGTVIDMRLRQNAFELARSNMEMLLSETTLSDRDDYGVSETNPDIEWETIVEPFYEPVNDRMWIRAVCSTSFLDSKDEEQVIELEHWITSLTGAQIKQIQAQQQTEEEYLKLLKKGVYTDVQKTTIAFLEQESLNVASYKKFLEQQRRQKITYLNENGTDGYEAFLEQLEGEENIFLEDLGMDIDAYNTFAESYTPPAEENPTGTEQPLVP